jgi:hypothetical protein
VGHQTSADIASLEEDDSEDEAYRDHLRELKGEFREYAPLMNRVVSGLLYCFELLDENCFSQCH